MALFEIKNLKFTYPERERAALNGITIDIEQGEFVVICGKSGCGKTTLLRHFKTVLMPYGEREGKILFENSLLEDVSMRRQASEIGYVLQNPDSQVVTDKVWHELAFGAENLGYNQETIRLRVAEMASFFGIQNWFSKNVEELSGGQKQILNLASVMVMNPKVLVLDEPTSQLDPIAASDFLATIKKINKELGTTIIMIEHRLEEVFPLADRVLVLENGEKIFYDEPYKVGKKLFGNDMFYAMPTPIQVYLGLGQTEKCPLTVCEGRTWLSNNFTKNEIQETEPIMDNKERQECVIEARELWFRYERNALDVVKNLSFRVNKGELYCILGGNGTGKSTTLSLLSGIRKPYRGKVFLNQQNINKIKEKDLFNQLLGVLWQNPQCLFVRDTVEEDLWEIFATRNKLSKEQQEIRIQQVIEDTEIADLLTMHPYDLSGGEQQRAALAKILLLEPQILLLDEPTKGLDGFYKQKLAKIFAKLKQRGVTILMVSHDIEFCAAYADRCALFFDGGIITSRETKGFFRGNNFYTTAANRMARHLFPNAVTVEEVIRECNKSKQVD